jgi:hypothetical protein
MTMIVPQTTANSQRLAGPPGAYSKSNEMSSSDIPSPEAPLTQNPQDLAGDEKLGLPPAKPFRLDQAADRSTVRARNNGIEANHITKFGASLFKKLVSADDDLAGLIAYGLYKQNKYEWLGAFEKSCGRLPTADESNAYVLGEGTPRRLATYRQLAESALAGRPPGTELRSPPRVFEREPTPNDPPRPPNLGRPSDSAAAKSVHKGNRLGLYFVGLMTVLAIICVWLLVHFGVGNM